MPGDAVVADQPVDLKVANEFVVIVEKNSVAMDESDMDVLVLILPVDDQPPFKLHLEKGIAVDMAGDEVSALPVIRQSEAIETIVSEPRCYLVEVVVFLLAGVQVGIRDFLEHATPPQLS